MNEDTTFEKYTARPGTKSLGDKYELTFILYTALKLSFDRQIRNFKFSTNINIWNDFDDAVFEIDYENSKKIVCVQLKHTSTNMTVENANKSKGNYSLDKYYVSYKKIKEKSNMEDVDIYFVLVTIGGFNKSIKHFQWGNCIITKGPSLEVDALPLKGKCFKFFSIESSTEGQDKNDFLSRFFIYTDQSKCTKMENEIRNLIIEQFGNQLDVIEGLFNFLDGWSQGRYGCHYKMTRNEFVSEVCSLLLIPDLVAPSFKKEKVIFADLWNEAVKSVDVTFVGGDHISKIWHCIFEKTDFGTDRIEANWMKPCVSLGDVKNVHKRHMLSKSADYKISLRDLYLVFWKMGMVPLVLRNGKALAKIFEFALTTSPKKCFIVVHNENITDFPNVSKFKNLTNLANYGIFETILKTVTISIQNRFSLSLEKMAELDNTFLNKITPDVFFEISENNIVGDVSSKEPHIYIKRTISVHDDLWLLNATSRYKIVFIFCDFNTYCNFLREKFGNRIIEYVTTESFTRDYLVSMILKQHCFGKNIIVGDFTIPHTVIQSILKSLNDDQYCIFSLIKERHALTLNLLDGENYIRDLTEIMLPEDMCFTTTEDNLFLKVQNSVNIINAPPGMGKSTLLNQICKNCPQNLWILKIELIDHSTYFGSEIDFKSSASLDYFSKKIYGCSKLTKICFDSFVKSRKFLIVLDGFDEVSPKFTQVVFNIMKNFEEMDFRQWITTRTNAAHILEKEFGVYSHSILEFDYKLKIEFMTKFNKQNVPTALQEKFRLSLLCSMESLDKFESFLDNPLQMSMLCEIVKSDLEESSIYRIDNILHLYEKFIDMKISIFERKYLKESDSHVYSDREILRGTNILNHQIRSMVAVFGNESEMRLMYPTILEIIQKDDIKIGIITHVGSNDVPIFIHHTYAEYFAATWLVENWKTNTKAKEYLQEVFFVKGYSMVKLFFDMIVSKNLELFQAVLDQNTEKIQLCEDFGIVDELNRTLLHLACSWKPKTHSQYLKILIENIDPTSAIDNLGLTPINYADRTKNVVALDEILKKYSFDLLSLEIQTDMKWFFNECVKKRCTELLHQLAMTFTYAEDCLVTSDYDIYSLQLLKLAIQKLEEK